MDILLNLLKFKAKLVNSYYKRAHKKHKINYLSWATALFILYYTDQLNKNSLFQSHINNQNKIDTVYSLLSDEKSKVAYQEELTLIFANQIINNIYFLNHQLGGFSQKEWERNYERFLHDTSLPHIDAPKKELAYCFVTGLYYHQYEYEISPAKSISVENGDIVLDCGAAFGDTAYWAYTKGAKKIYCFEIDPNNISILKNTAINNKFDNITEIVSQALGAACGEIYFNTRNNALCGYVNAVKENDNSIAIPLTTIDTFCSENNVDPTFIKMDIEGAEYNALLGAKETIRKNKPKLAISVYHLKDDMWKIPLLIHEIEPHYKFYCKKNAPISEFILYAICE